MEYLNEAQVVDQLNQLPRTFWKPGQTYQNLIASIASGLDSFTGPANALVSQATLTTARYKWLDLWGLLFSVPRLPSETDTQYLNHILSILNEGNTTPVRIESYIENIYNLTVTLTENFPNVGYTLTFEGSSADLNQLAADLGRIRPAGVPFFPLYVLQGAFYANTINFLNGWRVPGSYVINSSVPIFPTISASTTNALNTIPTQYLTDPILTGT